MNKLIVVTGGTKGIGRAILEKFAASGFDVVTCSRNQNDLDTLNSSLKQQYPDISVYTMAADLSQKEAVLKFAGFVNNLGRSVSILVNNTGIFLPGQVHNEAEGTFETMMHTNLFSAYYLTRALVNGMMEAREGHIFNICSTASIMPYVNGGSYCISKYALYGMTKVLREEMKPHGVRVTAVLPGATLTASWEGVDLPKERFMKSEDVAETVFAAYQLSEHSVVEELLIRPQLGDI